MKTTTITPMPDWLLLVQKKVDNLRFGVVQIVIHDSKVTQIESTEKVRFDTNRSPQHIPG
ncbi:MAG: YezD family protein [Verrucomicrobiota bacterium]|nr:YezD family protein [Verrucomicrobiota bacterium]